MFEYITAGLSFAYGTITGFLLGSPIEWGLHKHILHYRIPPERMDIPDKERTFRERAAIAHHHQHHGGFQPGVVDQSTNRLEEDKKKMAAQDALDAKNPDEAPQRNAHYYRDMTNSHVVDKFNFLEDVVGRIIPEAALEGAVIDITARLATGSVSDFGAKDAAYIAGHTTGRFLYWGVYESIHNKMHVLGARRKSIGEVFGDYIQGGRPDGQLIFSKVTLDTLCNEIESYVDRTNSDTTTKFTATKETLEAVRKELEWNANRKGTTKRPRAHIEETDPDKIFAFVAERVKTADQSYRASLSGFGRVQYRTARWLDGQLRNSSLFKHRDNNHYGHHVCYWLNLNVVLPFMDWLMGTNYDTSQKTLKEKKSLWLCPNSPDTTPVDTKNIRMPYNEKKKVNVPISSLGQVA